MKAIIPMRARVSRFFSNRYRYRERPGYLADFLVWGLIIVLAVWPMVSLAEAIAALK